MSDQRNWQSADYDIDLVAPALAATRYDEYEPIELGQLDRPIEAVADRAKDREIGALHDATLLPDQETGEFARGLDRYRDGEHPAIGIAGKAECVVVRAEARYSVLHRIAVACVKWHIRRCERRHEHRTIGS